MLLNCMGCRWINRKFWNRILIDKFKNPAVLMLIILFALALSFALLNVTIQVPF